VVLLFTGICQVMTAPNSNAQLEDYLYQYGYLPATDRRDDGPGMKRSEKDLEQATMRLQKFMGLEITGNLDEPTLELIGKPRCGMPDMVVKDDGLQGIVEVDDGPSNYTLDSRTWTKFPVTYGLLNRSPDLPACTVDSVIEAAVKRWTDASKLTAAKLTDPNNADIRIKFEAGSHGCTSSYGNQIAHAFFPGTGVMGDAHFNEAYTFTDGTGANFDLLWVAIHEFGHSFGVRHSDNNDAIMYPYYHYQSNPQLTADDKAAIVAKYGAK